MVDIKNPETAVEKIIRKRTEGKLSYSFKDIGDILRSRIILNNEAEVNEVSSRLRKLANVIGEEDFFTKPNGWGYRGYHLNIQFPNGLKAEIQLHTPQTAKAAEKVHALYTKYRGKDIPEEVIRAVKKAFEPTIGITKPLERGFIKTVREAPITAPEVAKKIKGTYARKPNIQLEAEAKARVDKSYDEAKSFVMENAPKNIDELDQVVATGEELALRAQQAERFNEESEISVP